VNAPFGGSADDEGVVPGPCPIDPSPRRRLAVDTLIIVLGALIGGLAILRTLLAPGLVVADAVAEAAGLVLLLLGSISVVWRRRRLHPRF
jgi:hypothetical protein